MKKTGSERMNELRKAHSLEVQTAPQQKTLEKQGSGKLNLLQTLKDSSPKIANWLGKGHKPKNWGALSNAIGGGGFRCASF